jgi:DNA-3-methyladenine glycosylase I
VARFTPAIVERLLSDAAIIRHRGKIESTINNARHAADLVDEFGSLAAYFWRFEPPAATRPARYTKAALMAMGTTAESTALSKDLRRRGWTFVGPTTVYAFMQAMGLVNDHLEGCTVRQEVERDRRRFARPVPAGRKPATRAPR